MTTITILISATIATWLWPFIVSIGFDPQVSPLGNLDDETRYGAVILAGWLLIAFVSAVLLVIA